nr:hypothetical protein [uncultured Flavobacterium sp.]
MLKIYRIAAVLVVLITIPGVNSLMASNLSPVAETTVLAPPTVDFSFTNNNSCSDKPITFYPIGTGDAPNT